jgi:hypothetical protein
LKINKGDIDMSKELKKMMIMNRIALLKTRSEDNGNIVRKLERKLRAFGGDAV